VGWVLRLENIKNKIIRRANELAIIIVFLVGFAFCAFLPAENITTGIFYVGTVFLAVLFAALSEMARTDVGFNVLYYLSFLVLFFVLGFRNFSAIDDPSYIRMFNNVIKEGWFSVFKSTNVEPGYLFLNYLVSRFTDKYLYMQLITAFIPLFLFYVSFKRYKSIISLPLAILLLCTTLYFQMLSVALVRMFISISIVFFAFYYIPKNNTKVFIALILLAGTFHYSSLFMLILVYFMLNRKNLSTRAKWFVIIVFVTIPIAFLAISKLLVPMLGPRYARYGVLNMPRFRLSSFDTVPLLLLLIPAYKRVKGEKKLYYKLMLAIYALSSIISFYSTMVPMGRLIFYANSAFLLAAPMAFRELAGSLKKVIFTVLIILYGFLYLYVTQFSFESHIPFLFPYENIYFTL
jgi:transmembrane protein EpsG